MIDFGDVGSSGGNVNAVAVRNLFSCQHMFRLSRGARGAFTLDRILSWKDDSNFLAVEKSFGERSPRRNMNLIAWFNLINDFETGSKLGTASFQGAGLAAPTDSRDLQAIAPGDFVATLKTKRGEELPPDAMGAQTERVGPAAYDAWQQSDRYESWLKDAWPDEKGSLE